MSGIVGSRLNIRGSGLVGSLGTDGQIFTSSGAGAGAVFEDAAGGGMGSLLTTATASSSAALNFTSDVDSSYSVYLFILNDIDLSADTIFNCRFYIGGSLHTGSDYSVGGQQFDSADVAQPLDGDGLATAHLHNRGLNGEADATKNLSGHVWLFNPSNTSSFQLLTSTLNHISTGGASMTRVYSGAALLATGTACTGISFYPTSGSIDSGTIRMYGMNAS